MQLEERTLEIFSANWNANGGKESFIKLGNKQLLLQRGYNVFGIKDGKMASLASFDGFFDDWAEGIQIFMFGLYKKSDFDYVIIVTHDDATNKTTPKILQNYLVFLECKELKNLGFRGAYVMVYDLKKKGLTYEGCDNSYPIHEWFELDGNSLVNLGIPIYLIVYNLEHFTRRSVEQLRKYTKNIHIIDNRSSYPKLLKYYEEEYEFFLHKMDINHGYMVWKNQLYWQFPKYFVISDPDLEYNGNLPRNFLEILRNLSDKYKKGKVGFALDLSDSSLFFQDNTYADCLSIEQWERQFWVSKVQDYKYELYDAKIDTTFCLINKKYLKDLDGLRVAGDFICKHVPWYQGWHKKLPEEELAFYKKNNISSGTLKFIERMDWKTNNHAGAFYKEIDKLIVHIAKIMEEVGKPANNYTQNVKEILGEMDLCIGLLAEYKTAIGKTINI